jgi:hypothetical protein
MPGTVNGSHDSEDRAGRDQPPLPLHIWRKVIDETDPDSEQQQANQVIDISPRGRASRKK